MMVEAYDYAVRKKRVDGKEKSIDP